MKTERTNFDGSWDSTCPHCSKPQVEHRVVHGPFEGVLYEHRLPCQPEIDKMMKERRRLVRGANLLALIVWILIPLGILILGFTNPFVGGIAFVLSLLKLVIEAIKLFGNPGKWMPGYKRKKERELLERHYIYHCDRNPAGFARLRAENFEKQLKDEDVSNKASENITAGAPNPQR